MDVKNDLANTYRSSQDKYVYYLIALSVASLGFSINLTIGAKLTLELAALGIAVLCWLVSIYSGLRNRVWNNGAKWVNVTMLEMMEGSSDITGTHPEAIQIGVNHCMKMIERNERKCNRLARTQERSLYLGVLFFILWRVLEMGNIKILDLL